MKQIKPNRSSQHKKVFFVIRGATVKFLQKKINMQEIAETEATATKQMREKKKQKPLIQYKSHCESQRITSYAVQRIYMFG